MNKSNFAFNKINYIICGVSLFIIVFGFFLMTGSASTIEKGFDPDIFSTRRIVVAPMTCFFGFLLMIVGILFSTKKNKSLDETPQKTETVQQK